MIGFHAGHGDMRVYPRLPKFVDGVNIYFRGETRCNSKKSLSFTVVSMFLLLNAVIDRKQNRINK